MFGSVCGAFAAILATDGLLRPEKRRKTVAIFHVVIKPKTTEASPLERSSP
jgi:uncharacterized membrane protein YadS